MNNPSGSNGAPAGMKINPPSHPPLPATALEVQRRVAACRRPLLVAHIRLDGDALGSELGLAHILRARGQDPHIVNDSAIPEAYRFLPGVNEAGTSAADLRGDYDLVIALDLPSWSRAKAIRERLPANLPAVAMDHHPPVERLSDTAWVDPSCSSVGEMVYRLASSAGWAIPADAATCLYVAILTDTGRFAFSNTTAASLRAAADLVDHGAQHVLAAEKIYQENSPAFIALRGEALRSLRLYADGRIAVMRLTLDMLARTGVDPIDTHDLADEPRSVRGAQIGVLLREMGPPPEVKVSLRAHAGVNVEPVARKLGGGGHRQAAGCEVPGGMDEVERTIVAELTQLLGPGGDH
jgi:phosphoesterase RecJ-like protein